ncbi:universal stress protein [Actinopolymorpha alba]|uniref:universal stress protein n=1 Tax=Actinopolymorpha alba TaxID=533267 RepID=UPI0003617C88|nr:universal stress protein [Actinopolymorpha alba]
MAEEARPITVGVDGSAGSALAIRWAIDEARSRRAPLRLVHAYQMSSVIGWYPPSDYDVYGIRLAAEDVLASSLAETRGRVDDLSVTGTTVPGMRVGVLLDESERANLLVVGARGLGRLTATALGSVSSAVAARAACPVVVIRGLPSRPDGPVVVGVDGTDLSEDVLQCAFDHASRYSLPLRAVMCWAPRAAGLLRRTREERPPAEERTRAALTMAEALAGWQEKYPDVRVERHVIERQPVEGLLEESLHARLLVVGAHGRHAIADTLLGSVSQGVLHHATCPVAVVHGSR